jgi:hypothetical protein
MPLHSALHTWSVPTPSWEHGVLTMQFAMQSNCPLIIVEQSMPIWLHTKLVHCAM